MGKYDFIDLDKDIRGDPRPYSAEAMGLIDENGRSFMLEDKIAGYETLTVTGRELLGYTTQTKNVSGMDGTYITSANYPARAIKVTYALHADSNESFRRSYEQLNHYLSKKPLKFYFWDDANYTFIGYLTNAAEPTAGTNWVVSNFTITCSSPFKQLRRVTHYEGDGKLVINEPALYPTRPDLITFNLNQDASHVNINIKGNQDYTISLTYNFKAGNTYKIVPDEDGFFKIGINDDHENHADMLDLTSDAENVRVEQNSVISIDQPGTITVDMRRVAI